MRSTTDTARPRLGATFLCLLVVAASATAAPPPRLDLDRFDASRQQATLPNVVTMAYVDYGPRDAPVVVLIHGYTSNARGWAPILPYLDTSRRYVIPDLRGHGRSSKPACCYDRRTFAYDIRLLLDALHIERADIVGTSLGSLIAQAFAGDWPDRTRRLVLQSSTGGALAVCEAEAAGEAVVDFRNAILALRDPIDPESPFMIAWYASPAPVDEEFLRRQRRDAAAIPTTVWLAILDQGLDLHDLQPHLARIQARTLLIWGGRDNLFGPRDRCSLQRGLPGAQVRIFDELGHNPYWEDPAAVARAIDGFLSAE